MKDENVEKILLALIVADTIALIVFTLGMTFRALS